MAAMLGALALISRVLNGLRRYLAPRSGAGRMSKRGSWLEADRAAAKIRLAAPTWKMRISIVRSKNGGAGL
jgi:hypothetical protein